MGNAISIINLKYLYKNGDKIVNALKDVELNIDAGEFISIVGNEGAGKSTLLKLIRGEIRPHSGSIKIFNKDITALRENDLTYYIQNKIGFISNGSKLSTDMTAFENVEYPLELFGEKKSMRKVKVEEAMNAVGLRNRGNYSVKELKDGERQRVELARALVMNPKIILADEPGKRLRAEEKEMVFDLLKDINRKYKITFVTAAESEDIKRVCDRVVKIKDGIIFNN